MPPIARRFPDLQVLLVDALQQFVGDGHTGIETPTDLEANLPFARVRKATGYSDRYTDYSRITIDVFTLFYGTSEQTAEDIRQWLCGPPPPLYQLDTAECVVAPHEMAWAKTSPVRRFNALYLLSARRHTL